MKRPGQKGSGLSLGSAYLLAGVFSAVLLAPFSALVA